MTSHAASSCPCATCVARRASTARSRAVVEYLEDRAAGWRCWRGASQALTWYARTRSAWSSPKGMPLEIESGPPSRGAESPSRRRFAAVAGAIRRAELDDRERHREKPAPLARWILEHFGAGRAYAWMESREWSEAEISRRMHRACRVVREHLEAGGWLED